MREMIDQEILDGAEIAPGHNVRVLPTSGYGYTRLACTCGQGLRSVSADLEDVAEILVAAEATKHVGA